MARVVVAGYIVRYPLAGNVWAHFQYLLGLHRLGHHVWFLEEAGWDESCYDPERDEMTSDPTYGAHLLDRLAASFGLGDRWGYRDSVGRWHGLDGSDVDRAIAEADLFLDVGGTSHFPEMRHARRRAYVDMDPVFTQLGSFAHPRLDCYDVLFTYGANIGREGCAVPTGGFDWRPLRPPVVLNVWGGPGRVDRIDAPWTTVAHWNAYGEVEHEGETYGQKDVEFMRLIHLPRRTSHRLEVAVSGEAPLEQLEANGWRVADPLAISRDPWRYRDYIRSSHGEFTVAKQAYVKARSGWFSDRTASYLASGRPVVVQDTGIAGDLPTGYGLVVFETVEEALAGLDAIEASYEGHCRAAREVAETYFDADVVLTGLLEEALGSDFVPGPDCAAGESGDEDAAGAGRAAPRERSESRLRSPPRRGSAVTLPSSDPGSPAVERPNLMRTLSRVRPYTMLPDDFLVHLARQVEAVLAYGIPGDFVECGVWRGGAAFLIADILRATGASDRRVWLFDSFEGLPPPEEIDGPAALAWAAETESAGYHDNARVPLEEVREAASQLGLDQYTTFVKGWFEESLPTNRQRVGPISLLRIDADWYGSVKACLDNLYDQVVDGGLIVFDDYHDFDGCAVAVHEFLGRRRLAHRLEPLVGVSEGYTAYQGAVVRKHGGTWKRLQDLHALRGEIESVVAPGETVVIVDDDQLRTDLALRRQTIPFIERGGTWWGAPPDSATAVSELERLREAGARAIVFAWPAFWWLGHYEHMDAYLRARFPCLLDNRRAIAFDLRAPDGPERDALTGLELSHGMRPSR